MGMYNSDLGRVFASSPSGVVIRNWSNRALASSITPPAFGDPPVTHVFTSLAEFEISYDGGVTFSEVTAEVSNKIQITCTGSAFGENTYDIQLITMNISGGGLLAGVSIRESPALTSMGGATMRMVTGGGYRISSFFDIFTEISIDGGVTWTPSASSGYVELYADPSIIPPVFAPSAILPPMVSQEVLTDPAGMSFTSGIVMKDVKAKIYTGWVTPPPLGGMAMHTYDLQVDFLFSNDWGMTFTPKRAPGTMTVRVYHSRDFSGQSTYQTEITQWDISGGDLPFGVIFRESPSIISDGGAFIRPAPDGYKISSFFDVFLEMSTDGGTSW